MRIPQTIGRNVHETYRCSQQTILLPHEFERVLRPEDESWDRDIIPELRVLAIHILVEEWHIRPILDALPTPEDRDLLLELLPTNLPFELMITWIPDEFFWRRAAKDRWEYNYPEEHGNSWRRLYVERHFSEYLEKLPASFFKGQQESCNELIELCKEHVFTLKIRSLIPTNSSSTDKQTREHRSKSEEDSPDHIPFSEIIPRLPNLTEIHVNFGLIYMNDGFDWRDFRFSVQDCKNLGDGVKNSERLAKFNLTRSNLDSHRVAALLHGMAVNNTVLEMNLSHCKLGDAGAQAIGEYLTMNKRLRVLNLENNYIGPAGVQGLVYGLLQESSTPLRRLNLRLNPIMDEGISHICALLLRHETLDNVNVSGCGLSTEGGINLAECLASGYLKVVTLCVDLSNNEMGPIAGEGFEIAATSSTVIANLDVRMCNFTKKSEYTINEAVSRNRNFHRQNRLRQISSRMSSSSARQRGVSLAVPQAYSAMQAPPPVESDAGKSLPSLRSHPRVISGLRSTSGSDSKTGWMLSRTNSTSKSKVEVSSINVSDTRNSAPNEDFLTNERAPSDTLSKK